MDWNLSTNQFAWTNIASGWLEQDSSRIRPLYLSPALLDCLNFNFPMAKLCGLSTKLNRMWQQSVLSKFSQALKAILCWRLAESSERCFCWIGYFYRMLRLNSKYNYLCFLVRQCASKITSRTRRERRILVVDCLGHARWQNLCLGNHKESGWGLPSANACRWHTFLTIHICFCFYNLTYEISMIHPGMQQNN